MTTDALALVATAILAVILAAFWWAEVRADRRRAAERKARAERDARDARIAAGFAAGWHGGRGR